MTHVPEVLTGVSIQCSLQGFAPVLVSAIYPPARAWVQSVPAQRNPTADPSVAAAASEAGGSSPQGPGAPAAPAHDAPTARAGEGGDPLGAAVVGPASAGSAAQASSASPGTTSGAALSESPAVNCIREVGARQPTAGANRRPRKPYMQIYEGWAHPKLGGARVGYTGCRAANGSVSP